MQEALSLALCPSPYRSSAAHESYRILGPDSQKRMHYQEIHLGFLGETTPKRPGCGKVSAQVALDDLPGHRLDHDPGPRLTKGWRAIFHFLQYIT